MTFIDKQVRTQDVGSHMRRGPRNKIQNNEYFELVNVPIKLNIWSTRTHTCIRAWAVSISVRIR